MIYLACTVIVCLTFIIVKQQSFASKERQLLLNRIQGIPEDTVPKNVPLPQAVGFDNDEEHWRVQSQYHQLTSD